VGVVSGWFLGTPNKNLPQQIAPPAHRLGTENISAPTTNSAVWEQWNESFDRRLQRILGMRNGMKRARALNEIADGLNAQEVREAISDASRFHGRAVEKEKILASLYTRWAELDPAVAFGAATESATYRGGLSTIALAWARRDPEAVKSRFGKLPPGRTKKDVAEGLIGALSESDPLRAFQIASANDVYASVIETLFSNWAERDVEEASSYVVKLPPGYPRRSATDAVINRLADLDVRRALEWVESNLAEVSPGESHPYGSPYEAVIGRWLDQDSETALRWLSERPSDDQTDALVSAVCLRAAYTIGDPTLVEKILEVLPDGKVNKIPSEALGQWWAMIDIEGALEWAQGTGGKLGQRILPTVLRRLADSDPQRAMALASGAGDRRAEAVGEVLNSWAFRDPAAAAQWLSTQPENDRHLTTVACEWFDRDASAAVEWMNSIRASPAKDRALSNVAKRLGESYPELAIDWIAGIGDASVRDDLCQEVAQAWLRYDPKSAWQWIKSASISEPLRTRLMERYRK